MRPVIRSTVKIAPIVLSLTGIVILLALGIERVIRELVVIPLSYLVWLLQSFVQSLPQDILWVVIVLFILTTAMRSLNWRQRSSKTPPTLTSKGSSRFLNRTVISATDWLYRMRLVALRQYSRPYFIRTLINVLIDVEIFKHQMPARLIKEKIKTGSLNLPADIQQYLLQYEEYVPPKLPLGLARLGDWFKSLLNRLPQPTINAIEEPEKRLIEYLEKELEIPHVYRDE